MAESSDGLGALITRVAQAWQRQAGRAVRPTGLTYVQFLLLAALAQSPGATQAAVAQKGGIDAMTASVALRNLERRRLIARRVSAADSRARTLTLTAAGATAVTHATDLLGAAESAFFATLGAARLEFAAVLGTLVGERRRFRVSARRNHSSS